MDKKAEGKKEGATERIMLVDNGWIVEIRHAKVTNGGYTIEKIFAIFGHGVYLPIDTTEFTDEQWDMFHERMKGVVSQ